MTKKDSKRSSGEGQTQAESQKVTSSEVNKKLKAGAKPPKEDVQLKDIMAHIKVADTFRKRTPAIKLIPPTKAPLAASTPKATGTHKKPLASMFNKPGPIPKVVIGQTYADMRKEKLAREKERDETEKRKREEKKKERADTPPLEREWKARREDILSQLTEEKIVQMAMTGEGRKKMESLFNEQDHINDQIKKLAKRKLEVERLAKKNSNETDEEAERRKLRSTRKSTERRVV